MGKRQCLGRAFVALLAIFVAASPLAAQPYRFIAFGDSISLGHGDGPICPDPVGTAGYPPRVRQRLANLGLLATSVTSGVCGEATGTGLSRIDGVLDDYVTGSSHTNVVVLMEGTNDVSMILGFESTVFNIMEMARKVLLAGGIPLVSSIIPRGPDSNTDQNNGKTLRISERLAEETTELGIPFVDPFAVFYSVPDWFERYYFDQLHPNPTGYTLLADIFTPAVFDAFEFTPPLICEKTNEPCIQGPNTLCLTEGRFRVEVEWQTSVGEDGAGFAVPQTDDTGAFWFFSPNNIELLVKVLDGRHINDHFWVFFGGLSDVEYKITVSDSETALCREYLNVQGTQASVGDTSAFFESPD